MSSNTTGNTPDRLNQHHPILSPTPPTLSPSSNGFHTFMVPVKHVFNQFCERIGHIGFRAHWMRMLSMHPPIQPTTPNHSPYQPSPAVQALAAEHIARHAAETQARIAAQERDSLSVRTHSLLNASLQEVSAPHKQTSAALEDLRAMMRWRKASLTQYGTLLNPNLNHNLQEAAGKQQALEAWEVSYETLRQYCNDSHEGEKLHATACYHALQALSVPGSNATVRYAGAFGNRHTCIQAVLSKLYASHSAALPLPAFLTQAMEKGAIDSAEALFSYGIDLLFEQLLHHYPQVATTENFHATLDFLQPFLPNIQRHAPLCEPFKEKLPTWLAGKVNETVQQGLLALFLDLLPDSTLRNQCVDLVEQLAKGTQAERENRLTVLLEWKKCIIQKILTKIPMDDLEAFDGEMEDSLFSLLRQCNESMEGIGNILEEQARGQLFSYGSYWLEWKFDHHKQRYSLTLYASGDALRQPTYPCDPQGMPVWPLHFHDISLTPALLPFLTKMSATTALTMGWKPKKPNELLPPFTGTQLFGEGGFITLLQSMGARLNESADAHADAAVLTTPAHFMEADMVSHYHDPKSSPSYLRYKALRMRLLEAIAPFGKIHTLGEPPHLVLPEGKVGTSLLHSFQNAAKMLSKYATQGGVTPAGLQEIAAFQQQLTWAQEAAQASQIPAPFSSRPLEPGSTSEGSLGIIVDKLLQGFFSSYGHAHLIEDYRDLLVFILGEGSAKLVDLLCRRARELQTQQQPQSQGASQPAVSPEGPSAEEHRQRGWIGKLFYSSALSICWKVFCFVSTVELLLARQHTILLPDALHFILPRILPQSIQTQLQHLYGELHAYATHLLRRLLFAILFPRLKHTETLLALQRALNPLLASLPGTCLSPTLPISLPSPTPTGIPQHPTVDISCCITIKNRPLLADIELDTHFWMVAQERCAQTRSFADLPKVLAAWTVECAELPHLLLHHIHTLPLTPSNEMPLSVACIRDVIQKLDNVGQLLFEQFINPKSCISLRDHQLAQFRLLGFTDMLMRQVPGHPFGDCKIDADPLLQEWSSEWTHPTAPPIYATSPEQALTVIRYFYPHISSLQDLIENPPAKETRSQWSEKRWFCLLDHLPRAYYEWEDHAMQTVAHSRTPEAQYFQQILKETDHIVLENAHDISELTVKYVEIEHFITKKGGRHDIHYLQDPEKTESARKLYLLCLAYANKYANGKFQNPFHWTVPLAARHACRARGTFINLSLEEWKKSVPFADIMRVMGFAFVRPQKLLKMVFLQHSDSKTFGVDIDQGQSQIEIAKFWMQEIQAIGMPSSLVDENEPLTAPSRLLRLIAKDPTYALKYLGTIHRLLFHTGHIEVDWQENPSLIQDYATAMRHLFDAAQDIGTMLHVFALALALRQRAWNITPNQPAFHFLEDALKRLFAHAQTEAVQWNVLAMQTLYEDYHKPNSLPPEKQKHVLSLLLSTLRHFEAEVDSFNTDYVPSHSFSPYDPFSYFTSLQQMATRWSTCMECYRCECLPSVQPNPSSLLSPESALEKDLQDVAKKHNVTLIRPGEIPLSKSWMEAAPLQQSVQSEYIVYTQEARIYRRVGSTQFTLIIKSDEWLKLLRALSKDFHWLPLFKHDAQCWIHEGEGKATLLVTHQEQEWQFVLEYKHPTYQLLGMLEKDGKTIVLPASSEQVPQWCASWVHFCPLSSMQLLVSRETGWPVRCHMVPFALDFFFVKTEAGWRAENSQHHPGYWIAQEQTVPFGLVLENQSHEQRLLLPSATLPTQALYAQVDPFLGILGTFIERQQIFHAQGSLFCYQRVNGEWSSSDAHAMVHLLLLYFASQKKEPMRHVGNALLRMQLPESIEMELLPLHLSKDRKVRKLHALLLAKLETSLLAPVPKNAHASWMSQYFPAQATPLLAWMNVYRAMAVDHHEDLSDTTLHTLFARYRRLMRSHKDQLISLFEHKQIMQLLSIDWLALHLLPKTVQERIREQEDAIGNLPSLMDRSIQLMVAFQTSPSLSLYSHPWIKQATTLQNTLYPTWNIPWERLQSQGKAPIVRQLFLTLKSTKKVDPPVFSSLSPQLQLEPTLSPESLSKETLIPYFFTYQAMAQGDFGTAEQTRLMQQLLVSQWTLPPGTVQHLNQMLLAIAAHPKRYFLFNCLRNRGHSLHELYMQYSKASHAKLVIQRERDLLHQWQLLQHFQEMQPRWNAIENIGLRTIRLFGTYYVLPKLSSRLIQYAVSHTSACLPALPAPTNLSTALPLGLTAGFATYLLYRHTHQRGMSKASFLQTLYPFSTPKSLEARLSTFNRQTGLHITAHSLSTVCGTALTVFGTRYVMHYASQTLLPPLLKRATEMVPSEIDLPTVKKGMAICLPLITGSYALYRLYGIRKKYQDSMRTKKVRPLVASTPALPGISRACQTELHAEDQRWRETLNQWFTAHFVSESVENPPVVMEALRSVHVQDSLSAYARQSANTPRTLYFLRSIETLDTLSKEVNSTLSKLEHQQKQELHAIFQALEIPSHAQGEAKEAFHRFLATQESPFFQEYMITEQGLGLLQSILPLFFLRETEKQQLQRIAKALRTLRTCEITKKAEWEAACEQLIVQMRGRRMYDISTIPPERLALYLAFESSTGTLLWKQQVETVSKVLDARGSSVAYELLMSLGKTFFAIPMTALSEADGTRVVFLVWPEAMYATQTRETGEQLFLLSGRPVTPLHINRTLPLTGERLDALLRLLESTQVSKGAISTRKRDLQSLELLFIEQLYKLRDVSRFGLTSLQREQLSKMHRLLVCLLEKGVYIGDEAHELFQDIVLNFPLGLKEKMHAHEARGVRKAMEELLRGELGNILRTCVQLDDKEGSRELFAIERERAARHIVINGLCGVVDAQHREELVNYLLNTSQNTPAWLMHPEQANQLKELNAVRGILLDIFPLFFTRPIGGAFGPSEQYPELPYVIPYTGNDTPAESRRIATPHETLAKTLVYYWHHGLEFHHLRALIKTCHQTSLQWAKKKHRPYAESPHARAFAALFPADAPKTLQGAVDLSNHSEALKEYFQPIQGSLDLLLLYSQCCVEPSLDCQIAQCSSSAQDFHYMFRSGIVCTGTAYNAAIYPLAMQRQLDKGTTGEAITHMKHKCPPGGIVSLTQESPNALLAEILHIFFRDKQATALMDGGGLLTGIPHAVVARFMLEKVKSDRPHIEVVDYFDIDPKSGETLCMSFISGAEQAVPMHACKIPLEKRLAYFDESHCFAANIPQPPNGKGVWLVGSGHPLYKGMQDIFRMRGLKKYTECMGLLQDEAAMQEAIENIHQRDLIATQTLYIALAPQVGRTLRNDDDDMNTPITLEQVLDYIAEQEEKRMETVHLQGGLSLLRAALRFQMKKAMLGNSKQPPLLSQVRQHFAHGESLFVIPTAQGANQLYGGARINVSGKEVIERHYAQALHHVHTHPLLSKEQQQAAQAELTTVFNHVMQLSLPESVLVNVGADGAYALDVDRVGREVEVEAEAETEREAEKEQEKETERETEQQQQIEGGALALSFSFTPEPWSLTCPLDSTQWQWVDSMLKQEHGILPHIKQGMKTAWGGLVGRAFRSKGAQEKAQQPPCTPPLFLLKNILANASECILRDLSTTIDPRIWWSNHLLPQVHLPFGVTPPEPGTREQRPITHLLIEVAMEQDHHHTPSRSTKILSLGCLGVSDANYWIKRLQSEHRHEREKGASVRERPESGHLFLIYQMPVLENLAPGQQFDGTVIACNRENPWNPRESEDFLRLEVMVKLCNGDVRYTETQCELLKAWTHQYSSRKAKTLSRAFSLFQTMAYERLGVHHPRLWSLSEIIEPLE